MAKLPVHLLRQHYASRCLDLLKMKSLVPRDVECPPNQFKRRIVEVVFDPLRIREVNARFKADGYLFDDGDPGSADGHGTAAVIAVNDDGSILLWGGLNSVYCLPKGERSTGFLDKIAFDDINHLVRLFPIRNGKAEVQAMIERLERHYTPGT
jgi:hypothetical protein